MTMTLFQNILIMQENNSPQEQLNTYYFEGVRFIPSYRDFDVDDATIEAANEIDAWAELFKRYKFWRVVSLVEVNGIKHIK